MDANDVRESVTMTEHGDVFIGSQIPGMPVGYIAPGGRAAVADALAAGETLRAIEAIVARWWAVYPNSGMSLDCMEEIMKLVPPPSSVNEVCRPT